jgi:hypothetical protein
MSYTLLLDEWLYDEPGRRRTPAWGFVYTLRNNLPDEENQ